MSEKIKQFWEDFGGSHSISTEIVDQWSSFKVTISKNQQVLCTSHFPTDPQADLHSEEIKAIEQTIDLLRSHGNKYGISTEIIGGTTFKVTLLNGKRALITSHYNTAMETHDIHAAEVKAIEHTMQLLDGYKRPVAIVKNI